MDITRAMPKYKEFKIEWQSGVFDLQIKEKLEITLDEVSFTRTYNNSLAPEGFSNDVKWSYKIMDSLYESKVEELCDSYLNCKDKIIRVYGCDLTIFTITVTLYNDDVIKEDYPSNLKENGFIDLIDILIQFIPQVASKPYFICDEDEDEDNEDDLPFDNKTKYFKDVDSKSTIVRKRPHMVELEYISKEKPFWIKTVKDHSYEREYYFGEGNTCLFDISFDDVVKKFKEYGIALKLLYDEEDE